MLCLASSHTSNRWKPVTVRLQFPLRMYQNLVIFNVVLGPRASPAQDSGECPNMPMEAVVTQKQTNIAPILLPPLLSPTPSSGQRCEFRKLSLIWLCSGWRGEPRAESSRFPVLMVRSGWRLFVLTSCACSWRSNLPRSRQRRELSGRAPFCHPVSGPPTTQLSLHPWLSVFQWILQQGPPRRQYHSRAWHLDRDNGQSSAVPPQTTRRQCRFRPPRFQESVRYSIKRRAIAGDGSYAASIPTCGPSSDGLVFLSSIRRNGPRGFGDSSGRKSTNSR